MAITIQQQPTSPNMSNNDLLWVLTSNLTSQPQYQFVCDIFESGSSTLVQRVKQEPNPSNKAVFNLGNILTAQMESDNVWKTDVFTTSSECNKSFIVKFGEEYGSSVSSSVIVYNGINTTPNQDPAKTGSAQYIITDGLVDYPNTSGGFNFDFPSYYQEELVDDIAFTHSFALSTAPKTQSIREGEYGTISLYNGNANGIDQPAQAQDIFAIKLTQYDSSGVAGTSQVITSSILRGSPATPFLWGGIYNQQTADTRLVHLPVGYQNLTDNGVVWDSDLSYYTIVVHPQATDGFENDLGIWESIRYNVKDLGCSYDGVRFAWKNEFGVWDYYTFTLQSNANNDVARNGFEQNFVPYNTTSNSATYDLARRGSKQFSNVITRNQNANSDWLTQAEADWLRELFFSTNVYIQDGTDFQPVVITDSTMTEKTNPRTQKVFQYQINFQLANQKRNRL